MPGSRTDLEVDHGGVGEVSGDIFHDEVGVKTGAIGGFDDLSTVEIREEVENVGGDAWIGIEGGVESEFVGASSVVLEWFVEFSGIIYERADDSGFGLVTGNLVIRDFELQHFGRWERRLVGVWR